MTRVSSELRFDFFIFLTAHPHLFLLADGRDIMYNDAEPDLLQVVEERRMGGLGLGGFYSSLWAWLLRYFPASVPKFMDWGFGASERDRIMNCVRKLSFEGCPRFGNIFCDAVGNAPCDGEHGACGIEDFSKGKFH